MEMKKYRILLFCALALVFVLGIAVGCLLNGNTTEEKTVKKGIRREKDKWSDRSEGISSTPTPTPAPTDTPDSKRTVTLWCDFVEGDYYRPGFERALSELKDKYPDIELRFEAFEYFTYREKLNAAMKNDELPDLFVGAGGYALDELSEYFSVFCLDEAYKQYADKLPESMFANASVNGHKYGVPFCFNTVTLFANTDLLKRVGYEDVPSTFEELMDCCEKLKAAGITPFGCSLSETWCVMEYLEPLMLKCIGADALYRLFRKNPTWRNEGVSKAVDILREMYEKGYFAIFSDDSYGNDWVKETFGEGKYAFYMNGSWNCGDLCIYEERYGNHFKVMEFPVIDSENAKPGQYIGGPNDLIYVSRDAEDQEVLAEYAFELGQLMSRYSYLNGCGLPAWEIDYDDSNVNHLAREAARLAAEADAFVGFGDTCMDPEKTDIYYDIVSEIITPGLTGEQFADRMRSEIR